MLSFLLALALAAGPTPSNSVLGVWKTETKNGVVEITRCGSSICGRLVTSDHIRTNPGLKDVNNSNPALRNRQLKGLLILSGFSADGATWNGGKIYNADDGKTYSARLTPAGNQLKVRGCIFVPLCKTQTWTRIR
jgi:uncharacterized protein (DUF2147 family)